jgi:hypothetical protein
VDFAFEKFRAGKEMIREQKYKNLNNQKMRRAARSAFRPLGSGVGGWSSMPRGRCIGLRQFASSKGKIDTDSIYLLLSFSMC